MIRYKQKMLLKIVKEIDRQIKKDGPVVYLFFTYFNGVVKVGVLVF